MEFVLQEQSQIQPEAVQDVSATKFYIMDNAFVLMVIFQINTEFVQFVVKSLELS